MSYKVKSLLYFCCFLLAIAVYYSTEKDLQRVAALNGSEIAEIDMDNVRLNDVLKFEEPK